MTADESIRVILNEILGEKFPAFEQTWQIHQSAATLYISGKVPVSIASYLNIALFQYSSNPANGIKNINRSKVEYFRPGNAITKKKNKYTLTPNDEDMSEYFDSEEHLKIKAKFVADCLKQSKHAVLYTGAGISTAAKIPDFRGPDGIWTKRERGLGEEGLSGVEQAEPTYAHNCVVKLIEDDLLKFIVSQNIDGLHRKSGIKREQIAEIHGNSFKEVCAGCDKEYLRDFDVCAHRGESFKGVRDKKSESGLTHITGRECEACGGMLRDTIVHFKESLPEKEIKLTEEQATISDLAISVGTSLRVQPACNLPEKCRFNKGKMIIVNLQGTGKDDEALRTGGILIHHKIDKVFALIMAELGYDYSRTDIPNDEEKFEEDTSRNKLLEDMKEDNTPPVEYAKVLPPEFYLWNTLDDSGVSIVVSPDRFKLGSSVGLLKKCVLLGEEKSQEIELSDAVSVVEFRLPSSSSQPTEVEVELHFAEEFARDPVKCKHNITWDKEDSDEAVTVCKLPMKRMGGALLSSLGKGGFGLKKTTTKVTTEQGVKLETEETRQVEAQIAAAKGKKGVEVRVVRSADGTSKLVEIPDQ
jgi:mono-ADP-ribosyltransferase sirtuin 6